MPSKLLATRLAELISEAFGDLQVLMRLHVWHDRQLDQIDIAQQQMSS